MMKIKLYSMLISNLFMLHFIIPLFKVLRLNNLIGILVKQLQVNTKYIENQLGGDKNE